MILSLGSSVVCSLCCSDSCVWCVDSKGEVYYRSGTKPQTQEKMVPVWITVDGATSSHDRQFTEIFCNSSNSMVRI